MFHPHLYQNKYKIIPTFHQINMKLLIVLPIFTLLQNIQTKTTTSPNVNNTNLCPKDETASVLKAKMLKMCSISSTCANDFKGSKSKYKRNTGLFDSSTILSLMAIISLASFITK